MEVSMPPITHSLSRLARVSVWINVRCRWLCLRFENQLADVAESAADAGKHVRPRVGTRDLARRLRVRRADLRRDCLLLRVRPVVASTADTAKCELSRPRSRVGEEPARSCGRR